MSNPPFAAGSGKKISFGFKFTAVCLTIILGMGIVLTLLFSINLRSITHSQIKTNTDKTMSKLQNGVTALMQERIMLLKNSATATVSLLTMSDTIPQKELEDFFIRTMKTLPDVSYLYYTTNLKWNLPGGCFVISDRWVPGDDYDQTKRDWFKNAKQAGGKIAYADPFIEASAGLLSIALSMTIFDDSGKDIGVMCEEITIDSLRTLIESEKDPMQNVYLLNKEGLFIVHEDKTAVMQKNFFAEYNLEKYRNAILSQSSFSGEDNNIFINSVTIPESNWILVSTIPVAPMFAEVRRLELRLIFINLVLLAAAAFVASLFTYRTLLVPLKEVEQVAGALADMNFTVDIKKFRNDEIGDMEHALITIRDSLKKSMDAIHNHLHDMTEHSKRLNTVITESSKELGVITGNMDDMHTETDTQMTAVTHTSKALEEIIKSIDSLDQAVYTNAAHITESSAAIEEMVANITSIRSVVSKVTKTTDTLSKSSAAGHSLLIKLTEAIQRMHDQSATLQSANKTIADIAGQTNILAMNAAIEAAHAGESGRGFAVVAGEIRKLAELSGKESNAISEEIRKIERGIEQITAVSNQTVGAMDTIFSEIKTMDDSFTQVNHAVEEQSAGGAEILIALKTIQDMTIQVRDGAKMIQRQSGSIHEEMDKLEQISQSVTKRAYDVKVASGSIASFLENTRELTHAEGN